MWHAQLRTKVQFLVKIAAKLPQVDEFTRFDSALTLHDATPLVLVR